VQGGFPLPPPPPCPMVPVVPGGAEDDNTCKCVTGERVKAKRIDPCQRIVEHVGVAVPGLGVGGVDGGESGGVRVHPAGEGGGVLAELGVVEVGFGVVYVAGEFVRGDARVRGVLLSGKASNRDFAQPFGSGL
jgi:hypothetical protein